MAKGVPTYRKEVIRVNEVGINGARIRAFQNPIIMAFNPGCGCSIVWAPDISGDIDKPYVLKYHTDL
jgi:hypothetical protein